MPRRPSLLPLLPNPPRVHRPPPPRSHTAEDELFDAPDIDQLLMDGMGDMDEALVRALGAAPRPKRAAAAKRAVGAGAAGELDAQMDADEMMEVPQVRRRGGPCFLRPLWGRPTAWGWVGGWGGEPSRSCRGGD